jgi:hypothetical protein
MGGRPAAVMMAVALGAILAACSGKPTATTATSTPSDAPSSAAPASAAAQPSSVLNGPQTLACTTVVDSDPSEVGLSPSALRSDGFSPNALTAVQVIGLLEAMTLTDGVASIIEGTLTSTDTTIIGAGAVDLMNYQGTQLASDAAQFASDEQSYDPEGPVDVSFASAVLADIRALVKDCPRSLKWADRVLDK